MKTAIFLMPLVAASVLAMDDEVTRSPKRARMSDDELQYHADFALSASKIIETYRDIEDAGDKSAFAEAHMPVWSYIAHLQAENTPTTCGPFLKSLYFDSERTGEFHPKMKFMFFKLKDLCVTTAEQPSLGCSNLVQASKCLLTLLPSREAVSVKFSKFRVVTETRDADSGLTGAFIEQVINDIRESVPADTIRDLLEVMPSSYRRISNLLKKLCDLGALPSRKVMASLSSAERKRIYGEIVHYAATKQNQSILSLALNTYGKDVIELVSISKQVAEFILQNQDVINSPEFHQRIRDSVARTILASQQPTSQPMHQAPAPVYQQIQAPVRPPAAPVPQTGQQTYPHQTVTHQQLLQLQMAQKQASQATQEMMQRYLQLYPPGALQTGQRPTLRIPMTVQQLQHVQQQHLQQLQASMLPARPQMPAARPALNGMQQQMMPPTMPAITVQAPAPLQQPQQMAPPQNVPTAPVNQAIRPAQNPVVPNQPSTQQQAQQPTQQQPNPSSAADQLMKMIQDRLNSGESQEAIAARLNGGK